MELNALEDVVRVIFPSTMMREGELLPAAFKLREHDGEAETYVSVFRQYADSFGTDILAITLNYAQFLRRRFSALQLSPRIAIMINNSGEVLKS